MPALSIDNHNKKTVSRSRPFCLGAHAFRAEFADRAPKAYKGTSRVSERQKQTKYNILAEKPRFFNPKSIQFTKMTKGDTLQKQYIPFLFAVMP